MITTFKTVESGFLTQPGGKLILRSSSAADTTQTLAAAGTVSASPDTESLALVGKVEVEGAKSFSAIANAILNAVCAGTVTVLGQGTAGESRIIVTTNPSDGYTLGIGLTGFTSTYTFKSALTGGGATAGEVLIGATASDTALNLSYAILKDATGSGTLYGSSTVEHPQLDVTNVSGTILTIVDKIACRRQLAWSFTQSGTDLSLSEPIGDANGSTIATFAPGALVKTGAITLDDEALVADLLPPNTSFISDWIRVSGRNCSIYLAAENVASAITASYDVATNILYPIAGSTSLTSLDNNRYAVTPAEQGIEYIRLHLTNPNSTAAAVNAKIVTS